MSRFILARRTLIAALALTPVTGMTRPAASPRLTPMFTRIDPRIAVAPQIDPADMAEAKAQGFTTIVNNRPDDESPDQPPGETIRAAAEAAGLRYVAIPIDHTGFSLAQVEQMAAVMAGTGPVLAFCRSGTRSTNLWALAEAKAGGDPDTIIAAAEAAGYNIHGLKATLKQLSGR